MNEMDDITIDAGKQGALPEDELMAYLEGRLSPEAQHAVELWLAQEGMESDAIDGLRTILPAEARHAADKINYNLRKKLTAKRKTRRQIKDNPWALIAVVVIMLLIMLTFIIIKMSVNK